MEVMATSKEVKVPKESLKPRRKLCVQKETASQQGNSICGSEAMSHYHESLIPVENPVPEATAIVVAETVEDSKEAPHGVAMTDAMSAVSSDRPVEPKPNMARDPPSFKTYYDEGDFLYDEETALASPTGTGAYSLHSRVFSHDDALETDGALAGSRAVRGRDLARNHQESSSTLTGQGYGEGAAMWVGPGREVGRDGRGSRRGSNEPYVDLDGSEMRPEGSAFGHYPYTQQMSMRSGLSHDLTGFSEFDMPQEYEPEELPAYNTRLDRVDVPASGELDGGSGRSRSKRSAPKSGAEPKGQLPREPKGQLPREPEHARDSRSSAAGGSSRRSAGKENSIDLSKRSNRAESEMKEEIRSHEQAVQPSMVIEPTMPYTGEFAVEQDHPVIFTRIMLAFCGAMLLYEFGLNGWETQPLSENPSLGPSAEVLEEAGAKRTDWIIERDEWWRLFTPMFLHAGVLHFVLNMVGFLQVGAMVERVFGWWRVGSIYLVSGVFGTIASAIFVPNQVMVGASGAIFGVFGALWADLWQNWSVYQDKCRALTILTVLTVVNVLLGLMPYLDNFAHIGGIVMGFFMGLGLLIQAREDDLGERLEKKCYQRTLQIVSLIVVPLLLILGLTLLYEESDPGEWCEWCENISCVELPVGSSDPWWRCDECSLSGFEAKFYDNGTFEITCPDGIVRATDACDGSTQDLLTDCCVEECIN